MSVETVDTAAHVADLDPIVFSLFWNKAVKLAAKQGWTVEYSTGALYPYVVTEMRYGVKYLIHSARSVTEVSSWLSRYHFEQGSNSSGVVDGW